MLHTCKVGFDSARDVAYVEGEQPSKDTLYVVRGDSLAVRVRGQWQIFALTPALFSRESKTFYRLPQGESDKRRAEGLHVCSWAVLVADNGLKVTQR